MVLNKVAVTWVSAPVLAAAYFSVFPATAAPKALPYADLIRVLDCATRHDEDQRLTVDADVYGTDSFRVRYTYGVKAPGDDNNNLLHLVMYEPKGRSAALFEVWIDGPALRRNVTLGDGADLEKRRGRWIVTDILNGGEYTYRRMQRVVDGVSRTPLLAVPRSDVARTNATCRFR